MCPLILNFYSLDAYPSFPAPPTHYPSLQVTIASLSSTYSVVSWPIIVSLNQQNLIITLISIHFHYIFNNPYCYYILYELRICIYIY